MRVVSLVPSGTLLLRALGLEPVGVSHSCPNPQGVPVVTKGLIPKGLPQEEIDRRVREAHGRGEPLYKIRGEVLAALEADLLVSQGVCQVCAVTPQQAALATAFFPRPPRVLELRGTQLEGLFLDIWALAQALDVEERGRHLAQEIREGLSRLPPPPPRRPSVAFLEWLDPPYLGGHWVPELVALAGGRYLGPKPCTPSLRVDPMDLPEAEVVFMAFCGYSLEEALAAVADHRARGGYLDRYLRGRQAYLLDAGPFQALTHRVAEGVWTLAHLLRGKGVSPHLARPL
ncbi:MAG: ABC transporter substrate-binding protein [Thermus caldifontis]